VTTKAYRGRYMIIAKMLNTINDTGVQGASRTTIMYRTFLSHAQLKEYLSFLTERGLVDEFPEQVKNSGGHGKYMYKITGKGYRMLQISQEIESIVGLD
jgi:predicted transcriptional regulator